MEYNLLWKTATCRHSVSLNGSLLTGKQEFSCKACCWIELKTKITSICFFLIISRINIHAKCPNCDIASFSLLLFFQKSSSMCLAVSLSLRQVWILSPMKEGKHSHLSLPLSSRLPGSSGGLIMTLVAEPLLQGGPHCRTLHLEVHWLGSVKDGQVELWGQSQ